MTIKVYQVATGNVGSEMIKRIADRPDLELIGVHCYSPDKVGRDAGELAGLGPVGVLATDERGNFDGALVLPASVPLGDYEAHARTLGDARCGRGHTK